MSSEHRRIVPAILAVNYQTEKSVELLLVIAATAGNICRATTEERKHVQWRDKDVLLWLPSNSTRLIKIDSTSSRNRKAEMARIWPGKSSWTISICWLWKPIRLRDGPKRPLH